MSIAEKLTTIAQNEQKVYDAGYTKSVEANCREFSERGIAVRCEPVANYPVAVVSELAPSEDGYSSVTLTVLGKNLLNFTKDREGKYVMYGNGTLAEFGSNKVYATNYIPCSHLQGSTVTLNHSGSREQGSTGTNVGAAFYTDIDTATSANGNATYISGTNADTFMVPKNANYMRFTIYTEHENETQLELGHAITEFEPYAEKTYTVDFGKTVYGGSFNWNTGVVTDELGFTVKLAPVVVELFDGVNTLFSDTGETIVSGRESGYTEYDRFWDNHQNGGLRTVYTYAYAYTAWTDENFKPKYDIRPTTCRNMFVTHSGITDLKALLEKQGVVLDTSKSTDVSYMFYYSGNGATITHIPTIDASSNTTGKLDRIFYSDSIKTVEKFIVASSDSFVSCVSAPNLERIIFEGTIGGNGLSVSICTKLDHDSLMSILNCLEDKIADTSGTSWVVTLGTTNLAKLTDAEKAIATQKGWSLA